MSIDALVISLSKVCLKLLSERIIIFVSSMQFHVRPRYSKQKADYEEIIACIVANGLGFGIYKMAQSCDISYSTLSNAEKNFLSLDNLREANDIISNKIAELKVFSSWNILSDKLLAGVDGQKFETGWSTMQARYTPSL